MKDLATSIRKDPIGTLRVILPGPIFQIAAKSHYFARVPLFAIENAQQRVFERRLGVSTRDYVQLEDSKVADRLFGTVKTEGDDGNPPRDFISGGDNAPYQPCGWMPVRRVLKDLHPVATDVFVDLGSGKGQVLLIAALHPIKRVTGVEYDQDLAEWSRRNIELAKPRLRAREVESIAADVLEWSFNDDESIVFLFNPFIGQTLYSALGKVFDSFDRVPRDLHIIYAFPWEHDWLLSTGRVVVDNVRPSQSPTRPWWWRTGRVIVSYRVVAPTDDRHHETNLPRRLFRPRRAVRRWSKPNGHDFIRSAIGSEAVQARLNPKSAG